MVSRRFAVSRQPDAAALMIRGRETEHVCEREREGIARWEEREKGSGNNDSSNE